jgi:uncharacterized SAM-binding protein YcdF (DUF218 family)
MFLLDLPMFFILSKVLLILLQPSSWLVTALLFALFLKHPTWKRRAKRSSVVLFCFLCFPVFLHETLRFWEVPAKKAKDIGTYDVGIVLGGMFYYNNDVKEISALRSADRIWQALNLYHQGKIKKILISGDDGNIFDQGLDEAKQLREVLLRWKIPKEDILIENISRNTYENAIETKKLLIKHPELKRKLLITSGTHMRRAKAIFDHQKMFVHTYSTNMQTGKERNYNFELLFIPTLTNMDAWDKLAKEIVGYVVYDATGRL